MGKQRRKAAIDQRLPRPARTDGPTRNFADLWICMALFLGIFATYYQTRNFKFVEYDDPDYSLNPHVRVGLNADALQWAFTSGEDSNWLPITRVSHLIDAQLFGVQSSGPHLINVLLHAVAALLLFAFLRRATGSGWRSALVALLFGIHPLHVESVAWVAERKDVLSALFWFLTLCAYLRYVERPGPWRYLLALFVFSLGLMSKPMLVTLPFVLLLLDIWPLQRLPVMGERTAPPPWKRVLWEKVPFAVLSAGVAMVAYLTQKSSGSIDMIRVPAALRVENALLSYVIYIAKMFWPANLAVLYPYPPGISLWEATCAGLALAGITTLVLWRSRDFPYLSLGWFWYLGTLVPVIGLVQIGLQSRADRYTYIPMVGLFLMLSWGAADLVRRRPGMRPVVVSLIAVACTAAIVVTQIQLSYWRTSESLYRRAIAVTSGNYTMHYGLGVVLESDPKRIPEAIQEYRAAAAANPRYWEARDNLATLLLGTPGHLSEAIGQYEAALAIKPDSAQLHNNLGTALVRTSTRQLEAVSQYEEAIRLKPDFLEAHTGLADTLSKIPGRLPEAIAQYEAALKIKPNSAELHNNLGALLARDPQHISEAIAQCEAALRINPAFIGAHYNLGLILSTIPDRIPEAIAHLETVLRANPNPQVRQMIERLRYHVK